MKKAFKRFCECFFWTALFLQGIQLVTENEVVYVAAFLATASAITFVSMSAQTMLDNIRMKKRLFDIATKSTELTIEHAGIRTVPKYCYIQTDEKLPRTMMN